MSAILRTPTLGMGDILGIHQVRTALVWGHLRRFHQRNSDRITALSSTFTLKVEVGNHTQTRLDPLSKLVKLTNNDGETTVGRKSVCYNLRGVMGICRYNTQPGGFMAFETIWKFLQFFVYLFEVTHLDPLSRGLQIATPSGIQTMVCYSLKGVMEIPRHSPHPKTNALIDCIYHHQALCCPLLSPVNSRRCRAVCDAFQHFTTFLDAFRQFWYILHYIYFEQDKTGSNICNGDDVKMVTSDLSARINNVLRYVGITCNMNAYIILSQALTLIAEGEDRLRAVEKEIYTPIADKNPYGPIAVQSTIRRASKVAWDLCPERVQALAGYPLNGRPSAVTMLELLYNGVARYDDLSILK